MKLFPTALTTYAIIGLTACASTSIANAPEKRSDRAEVLQVLATLDDLTLPIDDKLAVYEDTAVILVPGETEIRGRDAVKAHLEAFGEGVDLTTEHEVVELTSFEDLIVVQGRVIGTARPHGQSDVFPFETKNIILLRRNGAKPPTVWKVIYNAAPTPE